jgi:hypothetical protein
LFDTKKIEKIAPEYWLNSPFSIARYSGSCIINGTRYKVDPETNYLVRDDVWRNELRDKKKRAAVAKADKEKWMEIAQGDLFK